MCFGEISIAYMFSKFLKMKNSRASCNSLSAVSGAGTRFDFGEPLTGLSVTKTSRFRMSSMFNSYSRSLILSLLTRFYILSMWPMLSRVGLGAFAVSGGENSRLGLNLPASCAKLMT